MSHSVFYSIIAYIWEYPPRYQGRAAGESRLRAKASNLLFAVKSEWNEHEKSGRDQRPVSGIAAIGEQRAPPLFADRGFAAHRTSITPAFFGFYSKTETETARNLGRSVLQISHFW